VIAGLLLAVGCALAGSVSVLLRQRGVVAAPTVLARHPMRSAINLAGTKGDSSPSCTSPHHGSAITNRERPAHSQRRTGKR
jgi:hypothetical protein